jgi:predicted TIM-barrel fold metal-dependent hydrolase
MVDYWCNVFTPDRAALWQQSVTEQGVPLKVIGDSAEGFAEFEVMLARMDALGIATLVIPVCEKPAHAGALDFESMVARPAEIAEWSKRAPGRFVGLWSYDPRTGMAGVRAAASALGERWCVGLHMHTHSFDRAFDHAEQYPFYALAAERELPVVVQAGTSGGLFPSACGQPIGIDRPALYFREARFVLSHLGWPWVDEAIALARKFPNVYLGSATWPPKRWPESVRAFARGAGAKKLLLGTGFPLVSHRAALAQLAEQGFGDELCAAIAGDNARRIFPGLD